jgi:hypothetical protein
MVGNAEDVHKSTSGLPGFPCFNFRVALDFGRLLRGGRARGRLPVN